LISRTFVQALGGDGLLGVERERFAGDGCSRPATGKGRCDRHRRELDRNCSRDRGGGLKRTADGYDQAVAARDREANCTYPAPGRGRIE
jgi:hypothetical protein